MRKRVTQIFPFLIPIRVWQRNLFWQMQMGMDNNRYASMKSSKLSYEVCSVKTQMINENSGQDIIYQQNKVENLKIVSQTMDSIVIRPGEVFSFCYLLRSYKRYGKMKDGLVLVDGEIVPRKGGGICHLSNLLYSAFLLSPLGILERHGHRVKSFPSPDGDMFGVDATVSPGWLDLKVRNDTSITYQVVISFDENFMIAKILADQECPYEAEIFNENLEYVRDQGKIYETGAVVRIWREKESKKVVEKRKLYDEKVEITYPLPKNVEVRRVSDEEN